MSLGLFFLLKNYSETEYISKYKFDVYQSLISLDGNNSLRKFVVENDVDSINKSISKILNQNLKYFVVIYNKTDNTTIIPSIENKNVAVVDYIVSGDFKNYIPRKIKVFLWD